MGARLRGKRVRRGQARVGGVVAVVAAAVVLAGCSGFNPSSEGASGPAGSSAHGAQRTRAAAKATAAPASAPEVEAEVPPVGDSLIATTDGAIPGYAAPGQPSDMTVPANWYGYASILPVIATEPGWLEVRLAQRPNGSTTWVQQSDVTLSTTPYSIEVDLATMQLTVYKAGTQILDFPAGIGAPDDPTPTGDYFVTMTAPAPSAGYGPFVLVTSDHSDTITDWQNSGDAIIAIHGPITSHDDSLIGTTGAAISHGCIRLHDADLAQLSMIPAGTPVDIVAS